MGGITFLDYVKELPKGKREAKGATKGGYATAPKKAVDETKSSPAAGTATARSLAPASANGVNPVAESRTRAIPESGAGVEAGAIAEKIVAKVRTVDVCVRFRTEVGGSRRNILFGRQ